MMNDLLPYFFVDLAQNTPEWLAWRSGGIGASDAPTILGENPWKTRVQLLQEKCGQAPKRTLTAAMRRGTALEPEARQHCINQLGIDFVPACLQSQRFPWLRASVDGLESDHKSRVLEIKCGEGAYRVTATERRAPPYYYGQLQHILALTELPALDFWCYLPSKTPLHLSVPRDDAYIQRLLVAEARFWEEVTRLRPRLH